MASTVSMLLFGLINVLITFFSGLHFLATFFDCVLEDADEGNNQQNLVPFLKIAYETILQRYHGWMGGQLFNVGG